MPPLSTQEQLMSFLMELNTLGILQPSSDMEGSPAVLIMFQIVEKYHQASQPRPEEDHILIIMSTILWLWEFFPPTTWEGALLEGLEESQIKLHVLLSLDSFRRMCHGFQGSVRIRRPNYLRETRERTHLPLAPVLAFAAPRLMPQATVLMGSELALELPAYTLYFLPFSTNGCVS
jgi:hypothetical protein